jgi:CRP-like cAMP-binding protein
MNTDVRKLIESCFSSFPEVHYPKGQILLLPGDISGKVFHIVEGRVCQYSISYRGDEIIVDTFRPPAIFPMSLAMSKKPSKFYYKTEVKSTIRAAPAVDLIEIIRHKAEISYNLLGQVYAGMDSILERMAHLMLGTARSRLLFELVTEFRRSGNDAQRAGHLELNESSIAARSGLSRETVSREMKHLKDRQLVELKTNKIHVKNITELEKQLNTYLA